jgi:hypothetical protein
VSATDTIVAALNAALSPTQSRTVVYTPDKVPAPEPAEYATVRLARRYLPPQMLSGRPSIVANRLYVTCVSKQHANVELMGQRVDSALDGLFVDDLGPFNFETGDPINADEGYYVYQATYTF